MKIGLTYDLRSDYLARGYSELETAEFDREDTIVSIENALRALGYQIDRIGHAKQLIARLARGDRWDLVFNIAEGMIGRARESQIPAILDVYDIPYTFSDPLVTAIALDKGVTKRVVQAAGIPTARFQVVEQLSDLAKIRLPFPLFAKPIAEGTGKGVTPRSVIRSATDLKSVSAVLLEEFKQPVLIETYLSGAEYTVGILGTGANARVLGTLAVILKDGAEENVYSYVNKERCEELIDYRRVTAADHPVVAKVEAISLDAWRVLGCRDGGRVDIRLDDAGQPNFLEVNPLAGLHPEHSDLPILATQVGMPYRELIRGIVESASERVLPKKANSGKGRVRRESPAVRVSTLS